MPQVDVKAARLEHELNKQFRCGGIVWTWREFINSGQAIGKFIHVERYASRKRNGCYAELKQPRQEYCLALGNHYSVECPKIVYEWADVPLVDGPV